MGFDVQLKTINAGIKGVSIQQRKDSLVLVATLPAKVDGRKPHQQRIPTGHKADPHGLKQAHRQALLLASQKASGTFDWADWSGPPVDTGKPAEVEVLTVAAAVEVLEQDFWKGKTRTSAAKRTWDRLKAETDRLPRGAVLSMDLLVATVENTEAGSRTRLESCKVLKRLAKLHNITGTERLDALRTPYEPAIRDVPSLETVATLVKQVADDPTWGWCVWALATYGCRPAEVFSLRPAGDGTAQVLSIKRKGKLPTWRTALALPVADAPTTRVVPWDVTAPTQYDSATAKLQCDRWAGWLRRKHPTIQLYDLRHAWAIRSISKVPSTSLAAKCMGHDVAVHHRSYHRWIDQADIAAVAASL